jgi:uncharacterized protein (TIGR02266 family)
MSDERRRHRRAQLTAIRATYETAGGDRAEGSVHDLGIGGAFVQAPVPLPVGKRIVLDLSIEGEKAPITTTARVVWKRDAGAGDHEPAGMGVVFVDLDDAAQTLIARLTATRERTVIGVAAPAQGSKVPEAPVVSVGPRQRTAMGMGAPTEPEASLPIIDPAPLPPPPPAREKSAALPPPTSSTRAVTWLMLLILLIIALAFLFRAQLFGSDTTAPTTTTTDTATPPPPSAPSAAPPGSASAPHRLFPRLPPPR